MNSNTNLISCQDEGEGFLQGQNQAHEQMMEGNTELETTNNGDWEQQLPLHWYTLALILILILQIFICCGIYMWANNKLKKMKTE